MKKYSLVGTKLKCQTKLKPPFSKLIGNEIFKLKFIDLKKKIKIKIKKII